ncbi:MAG TPA: helix-hairpin-helix domain-containing protein [Cytophagaceae bacterium]
MIRKILLYLLLLIAATPAFTQSDKEHSIDKILEEYILQQAENPDLEMLYETMQSIYENPLDINTITKEDLEQFAFLTPSQIDNFLAYRSTYGPFLSIYELQVIPGFDIELLQLLKHFFTIKKNKISGSHIENSGYVMLIYQRVLEKQKGYSYDNDSTGYLGSPDQLQIRIKKLISDKYRFHMLLDKDPGERIIWMPEKHQYLFDFISANLSIYRLGKINRLMIGDYQLQFGQGLTAGGGFFLGKGSETILSVRRVHSGLMPYSSSSEYGFYRGLALELQLQKFKLTPFISFQRPDATQVITTINSKTDTSITSIYTSGLHRTQNEISKRKNQSEFISGTNVSYSNQDLQAGVTMLYTKFKYDFIPSDKYYQRYQFKGNSNFVISTDITYRWNNLYFFSEAAISQSKGKGILAGAIASLSSHIDLSLVYRNYDKTFHSLRGKGFSESAELNNEKGLYMGFKAKINSKWNVFLYSDFYKFPWMKYKLPGPTQGREYMGRISYSIRKKFSLYGQYKSKYSTAMLSEINSTQFSNWKRELFQVQAEILSVPNLILKSTGAYAIVSFPSYTEKGFILSQDAEVKYRKVRLTARVALFETESYDSRVYLYEKDLYMSFYFPSYSGTGIRNYIILQMPLFHKTDLRIKFARTRYLDRELIGSGYEEIQSSVKRDLKIQITSKF